MNSIIRKMVFKLLKIVNCFLVKNENSILFLPHNNCKTDNYDIINYKSDNVLCLFNSIIRDNSFSNYSLTIAYYDDSKLSIYEKYVSDIAPGFSISFINANKRFEVMKSFMHNCLCITAHVHFNFSFKTDNQNVICLSYYNPFKDDFISINSLSHRKCSDLKIMTEKSFDFHLATSSVCARITSIDLLLDFSKFCISGFPRNDIFYSDNTKLSKLIYNLLGVENVKIICYTPTFRDYERLDLDLGDSNLRKNKTIFGNISTQEFDELTSLLHQTNSILIYKLHPWQERDILDVCENPRIINANRIQQQLNISLYEILSVTDVLITDYTSTVFDFLHRNKPIIFYFYDYENYKINRGFSYNPVEPVCGGAIAKSFSDLLLELKNCINGVDEYKNKREVIHGLLNAHHDGNSCKRVIQLVYDISKNKVQPHYAWKYLFS